MDNCNPPVRTRRRVLTKQTLRLLKKAFADRVDAFVAGFGKLLQLRFLRAAEVRGHFHADAHVQIAVAVALQILHAFAAQPEHGAGLRAGGNLDRGFLLQA